MSGNMHDLDGWVPISCPQSDEIRTTAHPVSSLTDLSGDYGTPVVYTEWGAPDSDAPVLRDYRWPDARERNCEHYVPEAGED